MNTLNIASRLSWYALNDDIIAMQGLSFIE